MKTKLWREKNLHHFYSVALILLSIVVTGLVQWAVSQESPLLTADNPPKNIILMIGDGMGISHLYATNAYKLYMKKEPLNFFKLADETGLSYMNTSSTDSMTTDSAAAMTAMVTGEKTKNGFLSVAPDGRKLKTILEIAEENGKSSGVITTTRVTHATPAACAAHVDDRDKESEIAVQMVNSGVDVMLGGGWNFFYPDSKGGKRGDDVDVFEMARQKGFKLALNEEQLESLPGGVEEVEYPKFDEFKNFTHSMETIGPIIGALPLKKIPDEIKRDYGISLTDADMQEIKTALFKYKEQMKTMSASKAELIAEPQGMVARIISRHYGFTFSTHNHTAEPVPVSVCCHVKLNKKGMLDNTDIFKIMASVVAEKHLPKETTMN